MLIMSYNGMASVKQIQEDVCWFAEPVRTSQRRRLIFSLPGTEHRFLGFAASSPVNIRCSDAHVVRIREIFCCEVLQT